MNVLCKTVTRVATKEGLILSTSTDCRYSVWWIFVSYFKYSSLAAGNTIDCFECNSWDDPRCHDPWNWTYPKEVRPVQGVAAIQGVLSDHDAAHQGVRGLLREDGAVHRDGALLHHPHLHRPARDQLLHGQPRLHDRGAQVIHRILFIVLNIAEINYYIVAFLLWNTGY